MGMADIGFLTRFDLFKFYEAREKNASAAFVLRNLGPPALDEPLPTVINAAVSYKPIRPLLFAFDLNIPVNFVDFSQSGMPNVSLGVSANITRFLSMNAGMLYRAGSSRFSIGSSIDLNLLVLDINYTLDLLTQMQPLNRVSLGVRLDLGDSGRQQRAIRAEELFLLGLEAYSRNNIPDARLCFEEALRIDPKYEPAREGLTMLEDREKLIQRVDELHSLDF
jgi:hypothetical protein